MALIPMEQYDDLEKAMKKAKEQNTPYSIHTSRIKKDLKKRKKGRTLRIVILAFWAVALLVVALVGSGIIDIGGGTSAAIDPSGTPPPTVEKEPLLSLSLIPAMFVPATWTLCFVGFPIGWEMGKEDREKAKTQLYEQYTVNADGTVDTFRSALVPKLSASIFSLFLGALTMVASIPVAIMQVFTWKKQIARIESILSEVDSNELFVAV